MFLKPFDRIKKEFKSIESIEYSGDVEDNLDPLKLGRLKVRISIFEDIPTDQLPWSFPSVPTFLGNSLNAIMFSVPEIGSQVKVFFPTQDLYHPFYKGADLTLDNKCTFFDEDYPECYGLKDSTGNYIKVNKKTKNIKIYHSTGSVFEMDANKKVKIDCADIEMNATNKIKLSANSIEMNAESIINMNAPEVKASDNFSFGTGATGIISSTDGKQASFSGGGLINII